MCTLNLIHLESFTSMIDSFILLTLQCSVDVVMRDFGLGGAVGLGFVCNLDEDGLMTFAPFLVFVLGWFASFSAFGLEVLLIELFVNY